MSNKMSIKYATEAVTEIGLIPTNGITDDDTVGGLIQTKIYKEKKIRDALVESHERNYGFTSLVPTIDEDVKATLRRFGDPVIYFGEDAHDRRNRLRDLMIRKGILQKGPGKEIAEKKQFTDITVIPVQTGDSTVWNDQTDEDRYSHFFHEGGAKAELLKFRKLLWQKSSVASVRMLASEKNEYITKSDAQYTREFNEVTEFLATGQHEELTIHSKFSRPLTKARISPSSRKVVIGSQSGEIAIWDTDYKSHDLFDSDSRFYVMEVRLRGITDRVNSLSWNPQETCVASGSSDCKIYIWRSCVDSVHSEMDIESNGMKNINPHTVLQKHTARVNDVLFHPLMQNFVLSGSHDETWRLSDIDYGTELQLQESHIHPVQSLAIHPAGSLVASGDANGVVRLTDLRTGLLVLSLAHDRGGHSDGVTSLDFNGNGNNLASASVDNTIKIWDIRMARRVKIRNSGDGFKNGEDSIIVCDPIDTILGHDRITTQVKFTTNSRILLSAAFDGTVKLWRTSDWRCVLSLLTQGVRIQSADVMGNLIVGAQSDKYLKLWRFNKCI